MISCCDEYQHISDGHKQSIRYKLSINSDKRENTLIPLTIICFKHVIHHTGLSYYIFLMIQIFSNRYGSTHLVTHYIHGALAPTSPSLTTSQGPACCKGDEGNAIKNFDGLALPCLDTSTVIPLSRGEANRRRSSGRPWNPPGWIRPSTDECAAPPAPASTTASRRRKSRRTTRRRRRRRRRKTRTGRARDRRSRARPSSPRAWIPPSIGGGFRAYSVEVAPYPS